jgi:Dehydrogenases (flavoproteins)
LEKGKRKGPELRVVIYGAGPAGASLAYFLRGTKYQTTIIERAEVGAKPCAWGLIEKGLPLAIPKEVILTEINRFRIFLDWKMIFDEKWGRLGYIINKKLFLKRLIEESGSEVMRSDEKDGESIKVISTGHYSNINNSIPAIQYIIKNSKVQSEDFVDFYFFSDLIGYAWVFPAYDHVRVGIGGYKDINELKMMLDILLKRRDDLRGKIEVFHGARICDSGPLEDKVKDGENIYYLGEALCTVFSLTGEGIRPSIISSKLLYDSLINGKQFKNTFKNSDIYFPLKLQAKLISLSKSGIITMSNLINFLTKTDPREVFKLAIGDFRRRDLIRMGGEIMRHLV